MTTQISIRISEEFLEEAKKFVKNKGYINIQELMRTATREKIQEEKIREEYVKN